MIVICAPADVLVVTIEEKFLASKMYNLNFKCGRAKELRGGAAVKCKPGAATQAAIVQTLMCLMREVEGQMMRAVLLDPFVALRFRRFQVACAQGSGIVDV